MDVTSQCCHADNHAAASLSLSLLLSLSLSPLLPRRAVTVTAVVTALQYNASPTQFQRNNPMAVPHCRHCRLNYTKMQTHPAVS